MIKKILSFLMAGSVVLAQTTPIAEINTNYNLFRVGASPTVSWKVSYPIQDVRDNVDVGDGGVNGDTGNGTSTTTVITKKKLDISVRVLGVAFGTGTTASQQLPCQLFVKINNSSPKQIFLGRGAPVIPTEVDPSVILFTQTLQIGDRLDFEFRGASGKITTPTIPLKVSQWKWYETFKTDSKSPHKQALKNGDIVPSYVPAYSNQGTIKTYLSNYIKDGKISIGQRDLIYITECSNAVPGDMQDIVWLVTFQEK